VKAALVISERDNVATALQPLEPGGRLDLNGATLTVAENIPPGHKIALRDIDAGEPVVKYGSPIGLASAAIRAGAHVHTHNLASSRGRGDLVQGTASAEPRLAEPPDGREPR
jgi:altronate dehydratase